MVKILNFIHVLLIIIIATNLILFINYVGFAAVNPRFFIGLLAIFAFCELRLNDRLIFLNKALKFYIFILVLYFCGYFFTKHLIEAQELIESQLYSITTILSFSVIFQNKKVFNMMPKLFFYFSIFIVLFNIYEFHTPTSFMKVLGRSSGFYINPNASAIALICFFLLSYKTLKTNIAKILYVLFINIGVFLTLSRAGILIILLISVYILITGKNRIRNLVLTSIFIFALVPKVITNSSEIFDESKGFSRFEKIIGLLTLSDNISEEISHDSRGIIMSKSLDIIFDNPIIGQGFGSFRNIPYGYRSLETHNIYLAFGVDFGIFGLLVYPVFVLLIFYQRNDMISYALIITFLIWGMSSHNVLQQYFLILVYSYYVSKRKHENLLCNQFS